MFLKTLTIKGFKSFADSTSLHFEPGVTVIVGPNGSGKSNIVDAVAWVLGSQSPSTIRSSKMDDVIFAGTSKRPALGRAEVALTIDNSSGVLPIDFTEVTISRTLFRSGDSEYALNNVPCRLLDIQELLSDTGVGRHQHVIVSQGHLDAILQARPEDRRYVIEEAAGVLKFRRRREKAQRRLEATEANLLRLNDLLREVRRQLRPLERQADAARRHGSLVEELRGIRMHLVGQELAAQKTKLAVTIEEKNNLREQETEVRGRLAELDSRVMRAEVELTAQGQSETSDQLVKVEGLRQRARGLLAVLHERKRSIARELDAFLDQELIASLEADSSRLKEDLRAVEHEALELAPHAEKITREEAELIEARAQFEEEWGDLDIGAATDAAEKRGELTALQAAVQQLTGEQQSLSARLEIIETELLRIEQEVRGAENVGAQVSAEVAPLRAELDQIAASKADAQQASDAALEKLRNVENEQATWQGRRETLHDLSGRCTCGAVDHAMVEHAARESTTQEMRFQEATSVYERAEEHLRTLTEKEVFARAAVEQKLHEAREAEASVQHMQSQRSEIASQRDGISQRITETTDLLHRNELRIEELQKTLPVIEAEESSSADRAGSYKAARVQLEERSVALNSLRTDIEVRAGGIEERRNFISARLAEINQRLERHSDEREAAAQRRQLIDSRAIATQRLSDHVEERVLTLDTVLAELQAARAAETARVREAADALDGLRRDRSGAERQLGELQARTQRLQIDEAECDVRIESLAEQVRNEFDVEPETAMRAELPELDEGVNPAARARDLERELKIMGPINPLALEEFESLSERSQFLDTQLEDVKSSRKELSKIIKEVDAEIVQVFTAAFADVSENFSRLFEKLFPGGSGSIRLTDPDSLLETGVEIEARPGGKNLRKLSLLSGGERSLTALGFLFAVFRSRPSPFYLLDEVEAALDDVNLQRFLHLVEDFRGEAQLMIVSHQKRTMEAGDALYGVSMKPGESSKVISERIRADSSVNA